MAPTSKLLKVLIKNNILKLSRAPQKPGGGHASRSQHIHTLQLSKMKKQRAKEAGAISCSCFPPVIKNWPACKSFIYHFKSCILH